MSILSPGLRVNIRPSAQNSIWPSKTMCVSSLLFLWISSDSPRSKTAKNGFIPSFSSCTRNSFSVGFRGLFQVSTLMFITVG